MADAKTLIAAAGIGLQEAATQMAVELDAAAAAVVRANDDLTAARAQAEALTKALADADARNAALQAQLDALSIPAGYTALKADNTGIADVTTQFQAAVTGADTYVPAGRYLIDALRAVKIPSNRRFLMHKDAVLVAKPNNQAISSVLLVEGVSNVEIGGGTIIGERNGHTGTDGEGGHGIRVKGAKGIKIHDIRVQDCWGDGIYLGPSKNQPCDGVDIETVVCNNNRRNGLSVTNAYNVRVKKSAFTNTNGTKPQCGIDIEPNADAGLGDCQNVSIDDCDVSGNGTYGVNVQRRVHGLSVTNSRIRKNNGCGLGAIEAFGLGFTGNTVEDNGGTGLFLKADVVDAAVSGNTFARNHGAKAKLAAVTITGAPKTENDMIFAGKGVVGENIYG